MLDKSNTNLNKNNFDRKLHKVFYATEQERISEVNGICKFICFITFIKVNGVVCLLYA